jgi:hypothetical protein
VPPARQWAFGEHSTPDDGSMSRSFGARSMRQAKGAADSRKQRTGWGVACTAGSIAGGAKGAGRRPPLTSRAAHAASLRRCLQSRGLAVSKAASAFLVACCQAASWKLCSPSSAPAPHAAKQSHARHRQPAQHPHCVKQAHDRHGKLQHGRTTGKLQHGCHALVSRQVTARVHPPADPAGKRRGRRLRRRRLGGARSASLCRGAAGRSWMASPHPAWPHHPYQPLLAVLSHLRTCLRQAWTSLWLAEPAPPASLCLMPFPNPSSELPASNHDAGVARPCLEPLAHADLHVGSEKRGQHARVRARAQHRTVRRCCARWSERCAKESFVKVSTLDWTHQDLIRIVEPGGLLRRLFFASWVFVWRRNPEESRA